MTLLLLAGSGEARALAKALADEARIDVIASLAGGTRTPRDLGLPTRHGGFGGAAGFVAFLQENRIEAVLDATHPFAARMSMRSADLCRARGVPYLQVLRPPWVPGAGDHWLFVADETRAADHIPNGATVFLGTGRQTLARFANLTGRRLICRRIDTPKSPFPFENGRYLQGIPPFSVDQEIALFRHLKVDWLVVKNAGGTPSRSKLDAARALSLGVVMIERPPLLDAPRVETVLAALDWARKLCSREGAK